MISYLVLEELPYIWHIIALNVFVGHTKIALLSKHFTMLSQFLSFSMWKTHLGHWYVKCMVTIPEQNFTKLDMVYSDFMITTRHGFSLNPGFTRIWSPPDLPLSEKCPYVCLYLCMFVPKQSFLKLQSCNHTSAQNILESVLILD